MEKDFYQTRTVTAMRARPTARHGIIYQERIHPGPLALITATKPENTRSAAAPKPSRLAPATTKNKGFKNMKRLDGLYDMVKDWRMLVVGYLTTQEGPRKTRPSAITFKLLRYSRLEQLRQSLEDMTYKPSAYVCFKVYEPKERDVAAPATSDKVVQYAAHVVLEAAYHDVFIPTAFACRAGNRRKRRYEEVFDAVGVHKLHTRAYGSYGQHEAANWLRDTMREMPDGWLVKIDCKKFFYSIDREVLKRLLRKRIADKRFLWLMDTIIDSSPTGPRGIPLGSATSQNFANVLLNELDLYSVRFLHVKRYMRYQDDIFACLPTREEAKAYLAKAKAFLTDRLHLTANEGKTKVSPVKNGVSGLGYVIRAHRSTVKRGTVQRFTRKKKAMMRTMATLPQEERLEYRENAVRPVVGSFCGLLGWCDGWGLADKLFGDLKYINLAAMRRRSGQRPRKEARC